MKKTKTAKPAITLDKYDACSMMHTALRKCCDSKPTSAMYNLIQLINFPENQEHWNPWVLLGKLTVEGMKAGLAPVEALTKAFDVLDDAWHDIFEAERKKQYNLEPPRNARPALYALKCVAACFEDGDMEGMASYLLEE